MLRNYITIAFRSLAKNKVYSLINIGGLSVGVAVSLMIFLYGAHELSFDRFRINVDRIFRIDGTSKFGGQISPFTATTISAGPIVKENNSAVENYARIWRTNAVVQSDEHHIDKEPHFIFADTSLFSMFGLPLLSGNYRSLARPGTLILTEAMARKYFGSSEVIGKTLLFRGEIPLEIVGTLKRLPSNSAFTFDFVASFSTLSSLPEKKAEYAETRFSNGDVVTYLQLYNAPSAVSVIHSMALLKKQNDERYNLTPYLKVRKQSSYLYLFITVAIVILLLALVNYMNLTTARATLRAKEVGVRRVIGARRSNLLVQFYFESAFVTTTAFLLGALWMRLLLPVFLDELDLKIDSSFLKSSVFISTTVMLFLVCIVLAGSYPSIVLSRFQPALILKGKTSQNLNSTVRKGFTIFQFAASIALILVTFGIQHQLTFLRGQKTGVNNDHVMVIPLNSKSADAYGAFKNSISTLKGVEKIGSANVSLYKTGAFAISIKAPLTHEDTFMNLITADENFFSTLQISWLEKPDTIAKTEWVLNEAALGKLQLEQNSVGTNLEIAGTLFQVKGILANFNFESLHSEINPLLMQIIPAASNDFALFGTTLYIRINPKTNIADDVAAIRKSFNQFQTGQPFEYYFLDDAFQNLLESEDKLAVIFDAFTSIAIVLACLGLFGLITFTAEVRTREIGIRKVLGATLRNIFVLLSRDFIYLILAGVVIATPVAAWYLQKWLANFSSKEWLPWWYGVVAALIVIFLTSISISAQIIRAARVNPIDSLRSE